MLSAMDAEDGSGGLFISRNSFDLQYPEHPVNSWTSLLKGPLSTRGWAGHFRNINCRLGLYTLQKLASCGSAVHTLYLKISHLKYAVASLTVKF